MNNHSDKTPHRGHRGKSNSGKDRTKNSNRPKGKSHLEQAKEFFIQDEKDLYSEILKFEQSNDIEALIECIKEFSKQLIEIKKDSVSTSQLRNILALVQSKSHQTPKSFQLIRPKLAYIAGRASSKETKIKIFIKLLDELICGMKTPQDAKNFKVFIEAIVAYHKFYENKNED